MIFAIPFQYRYNERCPNAPAGIWHKGIVYKNQMRVYNLKLVGSRKTLRRWIQEFPEKLFRNADNVEPELIDKYGYTREEDLKD